jgi:hypothetical protein
LHSFPISAPAFRARGFEHEWWLQLSDAALYLQVAASDCTPRRGKVEASENCGLFRASILGAILPVLDFDIRPADRILTALHREATSRRRGSSDIPGGGPFHVRPYRIGIMLLKFTAAISLPAFAYCGSRGRLAGSADSGSSRDRHDSGLRCLDFVSGSH